MTVRINKPKIISIIPARGGSKGLPRKNIRLLDGKPLIEYTIQASLDSQYIDKAIVSTDDQEIADLAAKLGVEVINRPAEFARDNSPVIDAIEHVLQHFEKQEQSFDIVILLEPTSPLRKYDDIDNAITLFLNHDKADSLVSLGEVHMENPHIVKTVHDGYVQPLLTENTLVTRRQELPKYYFPYGVIYLSTVKALRETKSFYQKNTIPYFIERWQNYEVDDIYDFVCIESIMKYQKNQT